METSYTTKQGEAVLNLLESRSGTHFTADEIINALSQRGISVGKATVYRHLDKLIKRGLVRKYIVDEGVSACYEFISDRSDCNRHYHLKCSECGRLLHVECEYLDEVSSHILMRHGFSISPEKTVLYGVCKECREGKNA